MMEGPFARFRWPSGVSVIVLVAVSGNVGAGKAVVRRSDVDFFNGGRDVLRHIGKFDLAQFRGSALRSGLEINPILQESSRGRNRARALVQRRPVRSNSSAAGQDCPNVFQSPLALISSPL